MEPLSRQWPDPDRRDEALARLVARTNIEHEAHLTPTQVRCLSAASFGLNIDASSSVLGMGRESMKTHLKVARRTLAAKNTTHAVAIALRQGIIT